ncbi:unnamed protein product [Ectocarpus sp. 13 AM-2016]
MLCAFSRRSSRMSRPGAMDLLSYTRVLAPEYFSPLEIQGGPESRVTHDTPVIRAWFCWIGVLYPQKAFLLREE